jgi:hypothetical protein
MKPYLFQIPVILSFPMLKFQCFPFYKRYALSNLLIDNPKLARNINVFFEFFDPNKIKKPIVFKKCGTFTRIAVRSMDYYFRRCQIWSPFQSDMAYNHGRIQYFTRLDFKHKEITSKRNLMKME